jgi:hypothetical protein
MKQPYHAGETPLKTIRIRRLIEDLRRIVVILDAGIAEEEAQARVLDPTKPEYPFLARALAARKANLESTMASLERRIGDSIGVQTHAVGAPAE